MLAWTEYDHVNGFRYQIVDEGGSGYIRNKVAEHNGVTLPEAGA